MVLCTDMMRGTFLDVSTLASYIKAGSPVNDYDGLVMITSLHHTAPAASDFRQGNSLSGILNSNGYKKTAPVQG